VGELFPNREKDAPLAHIRRLTDKPRALPWLAHIHRKGHKRLIKMFKTKKEAEYWAEAQEQSIRLAGLPLTIEALKKETVGDLATRYLRDVTPYKGSHISEESVLKKFLKQSICRKSLAYVTKKDAYEYMDFRLKKDSFRDKPIKPSAVRREFNSIGNIFEVARERWGYTNLTNPFQGIKIKGAMHRRKRRLVGNELERLEKSCQQCRGLNRHYIPLAMYLAIETGMRQQEIFNLTWPDIDWAKRRIEIRKSKTDHVSEYAGRTIVIPIIAMLYLVLLAIETRWWENKDKTHLFPRTIEGRDPRSAFKQAWADVVKRANIKDLHFHDLRREAGSRFDEAGLTRSEHNLMMGHSSGDMASTYISSELKIIQDKLDRFVLGGFTWEEKLAQDGLTSEEALAVLKLRHERPELSEDHALILARLGKTSNVIPFLARNKIA
jgi:integrase